MNLEVSWEALAARWRRLRCWPRHCSGRRPPEIPGTLAFRRVPPGSVRFWLLEAPKLVLRSAAACQRRLLSFSALQLCSSACLPVFSDAAGPEACKASRGELPDFRLAQATLEGSESEAPHESPLKTFLEEAPSVNCRQGLPGSRRLASEQLLAAEEWQELLEFRRMGSRGLGTGRVPEPELGQPCTALHLRRLRGGGHSAPGGGFDAPKGLRSPSAASAWEPQSVSRRATTLFFSACIRFYAGFSGTHSPYPLRVSGRSACKPHLRCGGAETGASAFTRSRGFRRAG